MNQTTETNSTDSIHPGISRNGAIRCFVAMVCSHAVAPYAVFSLTIRYQLDGSAQLSIAAVAAISILVGALLALRQLVDQPSGRKRFYEGTLIVLWFVMAFVQLLIAADSSIPKPLLALLWGSGTIWIGWTVWAWCFFKPRALIVGSLIVGLGAFLFWSQIDIVGLTGDARVEFAWRKTSSPTIKNVASAQVSDVGATVWSGYLGTNRSANVESVTLREDWNVSPPQELWRVDCGAGWSSFAATEKLLFTQEQLNDRDCVTARSFASGELVWVTAEHSEGFKSGVGGHGPRATPALHNREASDDDRTVLFAVGPTGSLRCLKANSGTVVWQVDLCELFPGESLDHAICGSPLVVGNVVIVCPPTEDGPCLAAFDVNDGSLTWNCESTWQASYSSPVEMTFNNREQVLVHAGGGVLAVDPANGKTMWQFEWTNEWGNNATQPLQLNGQSNELVFTTGYRGGVVRIRFDTDSAPVSPKVIWQNRSTMRTKFCNVSQFGDMLVGLDNGILCGVDVASGKQLWKNGRYGHGQLLQVGKHCLIISENGKLCLLRPDVDGHQELASFDALDRKTWNHPILIHDRLIVRNDQEIVCVKLPVQD